MNEKIVLKNKPKLEITIQKDGFEIMDHRTPKNNGIYTYGSLKSVEINKSCLAAILKYIPFFWTAPFEPGFKNKTNLKIKLDHKTLMLWLIDSDLNSAATVMRKLNDKKLQTTQCIKP
ncbi:hypothetical protein KCTC52924_01093 [Arenibacter antarcticus]|uniref:Uncharacterized protein n=1 Tax=Arenibacter antarcticus TaxID=2040469 RepID=A0ABW5VAT3_9FLAO|nr:hypothetical protein [Arenibacter sp. H213]MCM4167411.1 hypothetical protein [Arenibacter sp. H213]